MRRMIEWTLCLGLLAWPGLGCEQSGARGGSGGTEGEGEGTAGEGAEGEGEGAEGEGEGADGEGEGAEGEGAEGEGAEGEGAEGEGEGTEGEGAEGEGAEGEGEGQCGPELCNGLDDDCDEQIDEGLEQCECFPDGRDRECGLDVGECRVGLEQCQAGRWGECSGRGPQPEACNALDDDCDGETDEELAGCECAPDGTVQECGTDQGECTRGVQRCAAGRWGECSGTTPVAEVCNGRDDDCDGTVDEELAGCDGCLEGAVEVCPDRGICRDGRRRCDGGLFSPCTWAIPPRPEDCNGLDDDCNGIVDDGIPAPSCRGVVGVCEGARAACRGADLWQCDADAFLAHSVAYQVRETRCDGLDNDCNGVVDGADLEERPCPLQQGVCQGILQPCNGAEGWGPCDVARYQTHSPAYESVETRCDGLDNDCDGVTDEDLVAPLADRHLGLCDGLVKECRGVGGWQNPNYQAIAGFQLNETRCDGLDNDCNGVTDPMLTDPARLATCQPQGECAGAHLECDPAREGAVRCVQEQVGVETCNGRDDDCDGSVDEGLTPPLCPLQQGVCAGSRAVCNGAAGYSVCGVAEYRARDRRYEAAEATCDRADNDCDGLVDEGLVGPACDPIWPWDGQLFGVCVGARQVCRNGDYECDFAAHSPFYEETETSCDGLDNDCDNQVDEPALCHCAGRAAALCTSFGPDWHIAAGGEARNGNLVCVKGNTVLGNNCGGCERYRVIAWQDGIGDRNCGWTSHNHFAGHYYGGHPPGAECTCAKDMVDCGEWEMAGCIPD